MQRRVFVRNSALALVTMGLSPTFLRRAALGMELPRAANGKVLICLFQRGAADALNVVVPHGERAYYQMRPAIAIAPPARSAGDAGAIDLDGFFGLHPALAPLKPLWDRGLLAPAPHARTLTRRITWRAARQTTKARAMAGSIATSPRPAPAPSAK